jgi:hypothetical protein
MDDIRLIFVAKGKKGREGLDGREDGVGFGTRERRKGHDGREGRLTCPPALPAAPASLPFPPCYPPNGLTKNRINEMSST